MAERMDDINRGVDSQIKSCVFLIFFDKTHLTFNDNMHSVCLRLGAPAHAPRETQWTSGTEATMEQAGRGPTTPGHSPALHTSPEGLGTLRFAVHVFHFCCLLRRGSRLKSQNGTGGSEIFLFSLLLSFFFF